MAAQPNDIPRLRRFTVEEYRIMIRKEIIRPDLRTELMEGVIYDRAPYGPARVEALRQLADRVRRAVGEAGVVLVQRDVELGQFCEVQPDIALLRPREDKYASSPPDCKDVLLLIEVSEGDSAEMRGIKGPVYARYGVPEAWIVDITDRRVFVLRDPGADAFREIRVLDHATTLAPCMLPDRGVDLGGLF